MCTNFLLEMSYDLLLDVAAIEESVLGVNVNWDLKMMSSIGWCNL